MQVDAASPIRKAESVRRPLLLLACMTFIGGTGAVPAAAQGTGIEIKVGPNFGDLAIEEDGASLETGTRTAFVGGVGIAIGVGPVFAFQPELLYSQKGADFEADVDGLAEASFKVGYVEIPLLGKVTVPTAGQVRPYFFGGPAVAFEVSCSLGASAGGISVSVDCDEIDGGLDRKKTDVGLLGGAGLSFGAGPVAVLVEGRYNVGLVNLDDSGADASIKTRTFSLLAGIGLRLPT